MLNTLTCLLGFFLKDVFHLEVDLVHDLLQEQNEKLFLLVKPAQEFQLGLLRRVDPVYESLNCVKVQRSPS